MTPGFLNALSRQERARGVQAPPLDLKDWDFEKPSRAVVACDGQGHGTVLWWVGGALWEEIEEAGIHGLSDLGLDDAPHGLSVWEGNYVQVACGTEGDGPEAALKGTFRDLDDDEAARVLERRNPWNPADWKMGARRTP